MVSLKLLLAVAALALAASALPDPLLGRSTRRGSSRGGIELGGHPKRILKSNRVTSPVYHHSRRLKYHAVRGSLRTAHLTARNFRLTGGNWNRMHRFAKAINRGKCGKAVEIFAGFKGNGNLHAETLDEGISTYFTITHAIEQMSNAWVNGLGDIWTNLAICTARVSFCSDQSKRLGPDYTRLGWARPQLCNADYGSQWGWKPYTGSWSAEDLVSFYQTKSSWSRLQKLATGGHDLNHGSRKNIYVAMKTIAAFHRKSVSKWTVKDVWKAFSSTATILGSYGSGYHSSMGRAAVKHYMSYYEPLATQMGLNIHQHYRLVRYHLTRCTQDTFGGIMNTHRYSWNFRRQQVGSLSSFSQFSRIFTGRSSKSLKLIFKEMSQYKMTSANADDTFRAIMGMTRVFKIIGDQWVPRRGSRNPRGIGSAFRAMVLGFIQIDACSPNGNMFKKFKQLGWSQPKICSPSYGKQWGWRTFKGSFSDTNAVMKFYRLNGISSELKSFRQYQKRRFTHVNEITMYEAISKFAATFEKDCSTWNDKDFVNFFVQMTTMLGTVASSYDVKLGRQMVKVWLNYHAPIGEKFNCNFQEKFSEVDLKISRCTKYSFGGMTQITNSNDENFEESSSDSTDTTDGSKTTTTNSGDDDGDDDEDEDDEDDEDDGYYTNEQDDDTTKVKRRKKTTKRGQSTDSDDEDDQEYEEDTEETNSERRGSRRNKRLRKTSKTSETETDDQEDEQEDQEDEQEDQEDEQEDQEDEQEDEETDKTGSRLTTKRDRNTSKTSGKGTGQGYDDDDDEQNIESNKRITKRNRNDKRRSKTGKRRHITYITKKHRRKSQPSVIFSQFSKTFSSAKINQVYRTLSKKKHRPSTFDQAFDDVFRSMRGITHVGNSWVNGFGDTYRKLVLAYFRIQSCTSNGQFAKISKSKGWGTPKLCKEDYGTQWGWKKFKKQTSAKEIIEFYELKDVYSDIEKKFKDKKGKMKNTEEVFYQSALDIAKIYKKEPSKWTAEDTGTVFSSLSTAMGSIAVASGSSTKTGQTFSKTYFEYFSQVARYVNVNTKKSQKQINTNVSKCTQRTHFNNGLSQKKSGTSGSDESDEDNDDDDEENDSDLKHRKKTTSKSTIQTQNEESNKKITKETKQTNKNSKQGSGKTEYNSENDQDNEDYYDQDDEDEDDSGRGRKGGKLTKRQDGDNEDNTKSDKSQNTSSDDTESEETQHTDIENQSKNNEDYSTDQIGESTDEKTRSKDDDENYNDDDNEEEEEEDEDSESSSSDIASSTSETDTSSQSDSSQRNNRQKSRETDTSSQSDSSQRNNRQKSRETDTSSQSDSNQSDSSQRNNRQKSRETDTSSQSDSNQSDSSQRNNRQKSRETDTSSQSDSSQRNNRQKSRETKNKSSNTSQKKKVLRYSKSGSLSVMRTFASSFSSSDTRVVRNSFMSVAQKKKPAVNIDESYDVVIKSMRSISYIANKMSKGLGDDYTKLVVSYLRTMGCTSNGQIYKKCKTKGWGTPKICNPKFGTKWGWKKYQGSYSNAKEVLNFYEVEKIIKRIKKTKQQRGKMQATEKVFFDGLYQTTTVFEKNPDQWNQEDSMVVLGQLIKLVGATASGHHPQMGKYVVDAYYKYFKQISADFNVKDYSSYQSNTMSEVSQCSFYDFNNSVTQASEDDYETDTSGDSSDDEDDGSDEKYQENDDDNGLDDSDSDSSGGGSGGGVGGGSGGGGNSSGAKTIVKNSGSGKRDASQSGKAENTASSKTDGQGNSEFNSHKSAEAGKHQQMEFQGQQFKATDDGKGNTQMDQKTRAHQEQSDSSAAMSEDVHKQRNADGSFSSSESKKAQSASSASKADQGSSQSETKNADGSSSSSSSSFSSSGSSSSSNFAYSDEMFSSSRK